MLRTDNVRVHERAHAASTDISTSCVLNGVGVCMCVSEELLSY